MAAETGTASAPSVAARARTASRCGLFSNPSSSTLATYITGFRVSRKRSRTAALSSSDRSSARAAVEPGADPAQDLGADLGFLVAGLGRALGALQGSIDTVQIGQGQLGIDR